MALSLVPVVDMGTVCHSEMMRFMTRGGKAAGGGLLFKSAHTVWLELAPFSR
jgi:hypothetical protein